ncbi:MAG: Tex-like N-terminal domain-containing protein [Tissierellia bacterium]|nr:Tex-like N-terminal domain-containing protein [Tissierellia bacterium]
MSQISTTDILAREFGKSPETMGEILALFDDGNTIPFVARYRKEVTGAMEDEALRKLVDRREELEKLAARRETVISTIVSLGKDSPQLMREIEGAETLQELEDLYAPYKPKRRTRAMKAREQGLGPLAENFMSSESLGDFHREVAAFEGELTEEEILQGVGDIIAEEISENPKVRSPLSKYFDRHGRYEATAKEDEEGRYRAYHDFSLEVRRAKDHQVLALDRGERTGALSLKVVADEKLLLQMILSAYHMSEEKMELFGEMARDSLKRLILPQMVRSLRSRRTEEAQRGAIEVFGRNLKPLLLEPPLGHRVVMGIDPGIRTGAKVAVVDGTGAFLESTVIYPVGRKNLLPQARREVLRLIEKHGVEVLSIGSGTASFETEQFISELIREEGLEVAYAMVSEDGASVYSASPLAKEEFPDLDVTIRGAISIARRLQDPLAELVKIEPRHIGVGQYQHDLDERALDHRLDGVVEAAVNEVGVDVNLASVPLLKRVSGLSPSVAKNIVLQREEEGPYRNRQELKKVKGLGPKAFQQSAGFLRIPQGEEFLDRTGIHPESYAAARILMDETLEEGERATRLQELGVGRETLKDLREELERPGRDIREDAGARSLKRKALTLEELEVGLTVEGVVRNVVDFGAFVDLGLKTKGLLHQSKLHLNGRNIYQAIAVGDRLTVEVEKVDQERGRIGLKLPDRGKNK